MHVDNAASVVLSHWIRSLINGLKRVGNWWMESPVPVRVDVVVGGRSPDRASMPWAAGWVIGWIGFWMKRTTGVSGHLPLSHQLWRGLVPQGSDHWMRCRGGNRC